MAMETADIGSTERLGEVHLGRHIEALQAELGVSDEALIERLGLSYNRFWDMKRRDWAQKKTVVAVAAALAEVSGVPVTAEHVLTGRLAPEQFAARAVRAFMRSVSALDSSGLSGGIRLPRLHLGAVPAGSAPQFEPDEPHTVVRSDSGDFVVTADGDCMMPTMDDGDEAICVFAESARDHDVVVCSYCDEAGEWQSGIKRLRQSGDRSWLSCDNQSADVHGRRFHPDIHPTQLRLHGVVVGIWRPLRRV
ncbi:MAG: S24 family peptidase [Armatimonadetes bacterium]|nr:S24 family peptidase [Armatimonadota bacterium]